MATFKCTWNDGDIVETHTRQSLEVEYASTNLFDNDFGTLLKALESDDVYIGHEWVRENMTIKRIR
jgi:hypothetical protein